MSQIKISKNNINWELVAVNPNSKNWDWKDLFCFWGVNIQSVIGFSLIASLYTIYDLNFIVVFLGTLIGSFFVYLFSNLIGKPSQKYGLPFVTFLRSSLGYSGAKFFGFLRGLVGIFMFGIQTFFLSKAINYLIRILIFKYDKSILEQDIFLTFLFGLNIIDWSSVLICLLIQIYIFSKGMIYNKKIINFSATAVYSAMLFFFIIILLSDVKLTAKTFLELINFQNLFNYENLFPIISIAGTIFAYFSIIIISFGDFSRYVKNSRELKYGNLSLLFNLIIFSFFAVFIVVGSDIFLKQQFNDIQKILTNPSDIIGKFNNLQVTVIVLIFIIIASASTNLVANFIPSQYSLINLKQNSFNLKTAGLIIGFFGFVIAILWTTLLSQIGILSFIDTFGSFFGPISGVMITNYYLIDRSVINVKDIHLSLPNNTFYFSKGWHIKGVYSVIIGFIFASSTIWNYNLMFLQSYSWIIGAFVSGFIYYLLAKK